MLLVARRLVDIHAVTKRLVARRIVTASLVVNSLAAMGLTFKVIPRGRLPHISLQYIFQLVRFMPVLARCI